MPEIGVFTEKEIRFSFSETGRSGFSVNKRESEGGRERQAIEIE
jgi:hypothetical protein